MPPKRLDRRRADGDHRAPVERAADGDDLEPRPAAQRGGDRRAVGHERAGVARRDGVDEVQGGAAAVEDHDLARLEQRGRGAGGGDLAVDGLGRAALVGARHRRARERAAVHALEAARVGELVEVAPDGVPGDAEALRQVGGDEPALGLQQLEDPPVALLLEHQGS